MASLKSSASYSPDGGTSAKQAQAPPLQLVDDPKDDKPVLVMDVTKKENLTTTVQVQRDKGGKLIYSINKQAQTELDGMLGASPATCERIRKDFRGYIPMLVDLKKKKKQSEGEAESSTSNSGQQVLSSSEPPGVSDTDDEQFGSEELVYSAVDTGKQEKRRKCKKNKKRLEKIHESTQVLYQETLFKLPTGPKAQEKSFQTAKTTPDLEPKKGRVVEAVLISSSHVKLPQVVRSEVSVLPRRLDSGTFPDESSADKVASPGNSFNTALSCIEPVEEENEQGLPASAENKPVSSHEDGKASASNKAMPPTSPTSKAYGRPAANLASAILQIRSPETPKQQLSTSPGTDSPSDGLFEIVSPIAKQPTGSLRIALDGQKRQPKQPYPTVSDLDSIFTGKLPGKSSNKVKLAKQSSVKVQVTEPKDIPKGSPKKQPDGRKTGSSSTPKSCDRQSLKSLTTNPIGFAGGCGIEMDSNQGEQVAKLKPKGTILVATAPVPQLTQHVLPSLVDPPGGLASLKHHSSQSRKTSKGGNCPRLVVSARKGKPTSHSSLCLEVAQVPSVNAVTGTTKQGDREENTRPSSFVVNSANEDTHKKVSSQPPLADPGSRDSSAAVQSSKSSKRLDPSEQTAVGWATPSAPKYSPELRKRTPATGKLPGKVDTEKIQAKVDTSANDQTASSPTPYKEFQHPYIQFFLDQEAFQRKLEECLSQSAVEGGSRTPQRPIQDEDDLVARYEELIKRQEHFVERAKTSVKRSDSFAQLIQDTSGANADNATQPQPSASPPRSNAIFYLALIVVISLLIAAKLLSRSDYF